MNERTPVEAPYVKEVSPEIYAHIQPDGTWFLNNTGFFVGSRGVTVVDQCGTEARARAFLERIEATTDRPVQTLINTHHHADHTFGNFVMPPHTTIVAHHRARVEQIAVGTKIAALFEGPDWGNLEIVPSFLCFEDRMTLYVDDLEVHLVHFGSPAHTTNDIVVWVPERRLLFAGDLAFKEGTPFALQGSIAGWLETIGQLHALGAETVVPGHGPLCGPETFDEAAAYLRFVQEVARDGFEAEQPPLELARKVDLGEFAGLSDSERIVGNLHRAYAELRGEPRGVALALPPIVAEMREYQGGPMVSKA